MNRDSEQIDNLEKTRELAKIMLIVVTCLSVVYNTNKNTTIATRPSRGPAKRARGRVAGQGGAAHLPARAAPHLPPLGGRPAPRGAGGGDSERDKWGQH